MPELWFLCSAHPIIVLYICMTFHKNMSSRFRVMEQTRKLLTDRHTEKRRKLYTPMAYFECRGYKKIRFGFLSKFTY